MRVAFAAGLVLGVALMLTALVGSLPRRLRIAAAGLSAFGIAGLSAAYAGWPVIFAVIAAIVAGGFFGWSAALEGQ